MPGFCAIIFFTMKKYAFFPFKKVLIGFLCGVLLLNLILQEPVSAGSSYSAVLKTEAQIRKAFPASYAESLIRLKKAHPNWNFIAFNTGVSWDQIFDENTESEMSPSRNLVYHTDNKESPYYKPSSWYSTTIPGSFNWADNAWTPYDSGDWYQASKEAMEYCIDPRNFFTEEQIFQFLDSASSLESSKGLAAVTRLFENKGDAFWLASGEDADLYDSVEYVDNPAYLKWVEDHKDGLYDIVFGDVNNDGEWDVFDIAVMGSYILNNKKLDKKTFEAADINGDGEVDVFDIAVIGAYILGKREDVPQRLTEDDGAPDKKMPVYHYLTYAEAINQACLALGINQITVTARLLQEQGSGTSPLISGTKKFTLPDKTSIDGGYYNYFNIGAYGNSQSVIWTNGLREAYSEGWDTRYKAIYGGARKFLNMYISRGQTTLYSQKFQLDSDSPELFWGQYMQNLTAPQTEAARLRQGYEACGALDSDLTFIIPVISGLPDKTAYPVKDGNPNYKMAYIWAVNRTDVTSGDYTLEELRKMNYIEGFATDTLKYEFTVPYDCENIHFYTGAYAPTSTILLHNTNKDDPGPTDTSVGNSSTYYLLKVGSNQITVKCTAENGDSRTYVFLIEREEEPEESSEESTEESSEESRTKSSDKLSEVTKTETPDETSKMAVEEIPASFAEPAAVPDADGVNTDMIDDGSSESDEAAANEDNTADDYNAAYEDDAAYEDNTVNEDDASGTLPDYTDAD